MSHHTHQSRVLGSQLFQLEDRITPSPAGDFDPTFGTGGRVEGGFYQQIIGHVGVITTTGQGYALATQPDGKVVVAGRQTSSGFREGPPPIGGSFSSSAFAAVRVNPDGQLDTTFGSAGRSGYDMGADSGVWAVAIQPDGKIILAGEAGTGGAVARVLSDGSLDPTFGTGGKVLLAIPGGFKGVTLQPDGRIVLVGGTQTPTGGADFAAVRLLPDGTLDSTFGAGGIDAIDLGASTGESAAGVVVQPDGRIVVVGTTDGGATGADFAAVRLLTDGSLDPAFGTGGKAVFAFPAGANQSDTATDVALGTDGTLVIAGAVGGGDLGAVRVTGDGALDPGFGSGGRVVVSLGRTSLSGADVLVQRDGKVVLASTGSGFTVVRLLADGSADPTFGTAGRVDTSRTSEAIAVQPDGRIVLAGMTVGPDMLAARLLGDPPTIGGIPDGTVPANATLGPLSFAVGYGAGDPALLTVTASSNNPFLIPDAAIVLGGTGAGRTLTITPLTGQSGTATVTVTVRDAAGQAATETFQVTVLPPPPPPPPPVPVPQMALVGGLPDGTARTLDPTGGPYALGAALSFFPDFAGVVRTATADVTGDGVPDWIGGAGPGGGPRVVVLDGATGGRVADFFAFEPTFSGGVFVAAADLDGDGRAELAVTPDGGGPVVAVFDGLGGELARFFGIEDPNFHGGSRVALGDLNGDGTPDLIVSAGIGGGPRIAVFDGRSVAGGGGPVKLMGDFFAFEHTLRNGAFVAAGDVTGDGVADLAFGGGPGGAPRVRVVSGPVLLAAGQLGRTTLDGETGLTTEQFQQQMRLGDPFVLPLSELADFFVGDSSLRGGVRLALKDANGDGKADLLTGSGEREPSQIRVYRAGSLLANPAPAADQVLDPFGADLADGVFVG